MPNPCPTPSRRRLTAIRRPGVVARGEDGFILLESIVAISLITVILAALGTLTLRSVTATNELRARQAATQVATTAMTTIDALPAGDLVSKRDKASVEEQLARYPSNSTINNALAFMAEAYDTTPGLPADAGRTATIPTSTQLVTLNAITYSVDTFVGTCVIPGVADEDPVVPVSWYCVKSGTGVTAYRAVVAVTWPSGRGCTNTAGCTYVSSTVVNATDDPVFNTNRSTPPATPIVVPPGDQTATVGGPVSLQLKVKSGTGVNPMTWTLPSGTLPTGLILGGDGVISGTPTAVTASPATVTAMVTDAFGRTGTTTFSWTVLAAPTITTPANQTTRLNTATTVNIASTCPNAPCTYAMSGAPAGLSIDTATGVVSGSPTTVGTSSNVVVTVTDAAVVSASTNPFTWTIAAPGPTVTSPGNQKLTVGTSVSIPIPYTCPNPTCTITLTNGIPGLVLTKPASTGSSTPETASKFTTPGTVDTTGTTNLSVGRTATQSSTNFGGSPSRAVDGNTDGVYNNGSISHTDFEAQPWWQVDLGSASLVRAVRIWNRTDCCDTRLANFYVFTSPTDMTGRTAAQLLADQTVAVQRISGLNGQPSITIPAQSAGRYVRVQLAGFNGSDYLSLAEVQVLGTADTGTSVTVSNTSGTVYATGTVAASAVPSGSTSKAYTPGLSIVDVSAASDSKSAGTWTAYARPTVASLQTRSLRASTSPSVPVDYTCPNVPCTLALSAQPSGLGLSTAASSATANSTVSLTLTNPSGTVYVNGLIAANAAPSGSSRVYSPTVTITDAGTASTTGSGSWTVTTQPTLTNPGTQAMEANQSGGVQLTSTCPSGNCAWSASVAFNAAGPYYNVGISNTGYLAISAGSASTYYLRVTVTDSAGQTDTVTFTLNVVAAFTLSVPNQTTRTTAGTTVVTVDVAALVSPQASGYTYALSGAPSWLSIDRTTGLMTASVTSSSQTDSSITVTVTSTASSSSSVARTFSWTIQ